MKLTTICLLMILFAVPFAAQAADLSACVTPVYFMGAAGLRFGSGLVVGDGSLVVTTADLATEQINDKINRTIKYAMVIVPSTGEAYRAEVAHIDAKSNVVVLKLPVKGLSAYPIAEDRVIQSAPFGTLGQMLQQDFTGGRWDTELSAYTRNKDTGKLDLTTWRAKKAFTTEAKGSKWLFASEIQPDDVIPSGAVLTRPDSGALACYVSKFTIQSGAKSTDLRMCSPVSTITQALTKAGASTNELRTPPAPTYKPDGKESEVFQTTSRVLVSLLSGSWDKALTDAKSLSSLRPESPGIQTLYGMALAGTGKAEDAIKAFDKAISADPKLTSAYLSRGGAYASLKKTKEAEVDYRKAMELAPGDVRPLAWLSGLLTIDKARLAESIQLAERAVNMEPDLPDTYLALAHALAVKGDNEKAAAELKKALEITPKFTAARMALGSTYAAMDKHEEAEKEFRKLAEDEPKNPSALFSLAAYLKSRGQDEETKKIVDKILALNPPKELKTAAEDLLKEKKDESK